MLLYHTKDRLLFRATRLHAILLSVGIALLLAGCSSSRHVVKTTEGKDIYTLAGLKKERRDNAALYKEGSSWLFVPHREGGTSRSGTDCSFLIYSLYKTVYNKNIERNSAAMMQKNCVRIDRSSLKEGDLVFFNTTGKRGASVNHVGIYLKNNKFLHASTSKGVIVSDLNEGYYLKTWVTGGRVK